MQKRLLNLLGILFILAGCGSNPTNSDLSSAQDSLSNGDYDSALSKAQAIIDSPTASNEDKQTAYYVKGYALLGKGNINVTSAINDMQSESIPFRRLLALGVDLTSSSAIAAADAMNAADALGNAASAYRMWKATTAPTTPQYRARLIANATAMVNLLTSYIDIDSSGNIVPKSGYTIKTALAALYPADGKGLLHHAAVVAVTYTKCDFNSSTVAKIFQAINAVVYISYINGASTPGAAYIYRSADNVHTIRTTSTDDEIIAAVKYELGKVF